MLESEIEKYLKTEVEKAGALCWKFMSPGNAGVPDRIVLLPDGRTWFIELKAPGKAPRPLQMKRIRQLQSLKQRVFVIDSKEEVDTLAEMARFVTESVNYAEVADIAEQVEKTLQKGKTPK
ncbi:VRR-NUC domain-containing protein [Listeria ilorinensis]|uniref:VRR-NUC domain-containing protein n=1 Tax=Listeria ilorinensis TaxID=2867439 RepID=UPI00207C0ECD